MIRTLKQSYVHLFSSIRSNNTNFNFFAKFTFVLYKIVLGTEYDKFEPAVGRSKLIEIQNKFKFLKFYQIFFHGFQPTVLILLN